ncbi:immunoglobulin-like domain-containing protein, partial [Listeria cornellensis]|uniref:immunoglobulin-like domain-containing protein n=1 Tax=Listeria cornellensis TaxID=1494961 RepID=UPI00055EE63F
VNTEKAGVYHVTYSVTDSDGNTTTKTIQVTILTNDAPVITTSDVYLKAGDTFNPLDGITASDLEDGDLTSSIQVVSSNVNMKSEGLYAVVYSVTDSDGNTTTVTRHVYVRTNDKPEIHVSDQTFKAGFAFDPMTIVSASDLEDGDVTKAVKITSNNVNPDVAGTYAITYSVTDSDNNTTTKTITVTVLTNEKPVITAADRTVKAHLAFDPMTGVSASDLEDGDISDNIK